MRRLIGVLRRSELEPLPSAEPGMSLVAGLVERARASGLDVDLRVEGVRRRLPAGVDLTAFRVVQEALTNTIKHAGPTHAQVAITYSASALELEITDTGETLRRGRGARGRGRPACAALTPGGNGLAGMGDG